MTSSVLVSGTTLKRQRAKMPRSRYRRPSAHSPVFSASGCPLNLGPVDAVCEDDRGAVGEGELVVAGGQSSPLLRESEGVGGDVASLVGDRVEPRRPPSLGAFALAGSDLVPLPRDHARDPAPGEESAVAPRGVGAVGEALVGASAGPAPARSRSPDLGQHLDQHRAIIALPAGDGRRQRTPVPIDHGMDRRRQPFSRPTGPVTCRFTPTTQGTRGKVLTARPVIHSGPRVLCGTGCVARVLMRTRDRRVDRHVPGHLPGRVGRGEELLEDVIPGAVRGIAAMSLPGCLPRSETLSWKVLPRDPGAAPIDDALDDLATVLERTPPPAIA